MAFSDIGPRILSERERKRWTHDVLARRVGVSPSTISKWERGAAYPTQENERRLAYALRCSLLWLLAGDSGHEATVIPLRLRTDPSPASAAQEVEP